MQINSVNNEPLSFLSMTVMCSNSDPQWQELPRQFDDLIMVVNFMCYETLLLRVSIIQTKDLV